MEEFIFTTNDGYVEISLDKVCKHCCLEVIGFELTYEDLLKIKKTLDEIFNPFSPV